jgi:type I restriction enzyme M protein
LEAEVAATEQKLDELREEQGGEDGLLAEANEANEGEESRITARSVRAALRKLEDDADSTDEVKALKEYETLLDA